MIVIYDRITFYNTDHSGLVNPFLKSLILDMIIQAPQHQSQAYEPFSSLRVLASSYKLMIAWL